jgi:RNA polymerase sigma-70 factor (ECF subfamily)
MFKNLKPANSISQMDDTLIVQELHRHNREAYTIMYEKYYKVLLAHADYLLKDHAEAEEAVQEVFFKLLQVKGWDHVQNLRSYLYKVLHNYCIAKITQARKLETKKDGLRVVLQHDSWEDPDARRDKYATDQKLQQLLSHLSPQRLRAFYLVYQEGYSYQEAAAYLGISKNSIKTHIKLGLKVLRGLGPIIYIIFFYLP